MNKSDQTNPLLSVLLAPVKALFVSESKQGILLIVVAAAALIAANSIFAEAYHHFFHDRLSWTPIPKLNTAHLWINDGLMAIFFFVVGLEVKREIIEGQLSSPEQRRLPVVAAISGMIAPALVYLSIAGGVPGLTRGWAIPAATDIAFAMGVLGLLGNRVPASLRMFLLTVAIVDDIGAVLIIALFFTAGIKLTWLIGALVVVGVMVALNRARHSVTTTYILLALVLWFCILNSGVHATVAGVVAALTIPMRGRDNDTMVERVEHALAPWSAYLIVPVFGFANAGVHVTDLGPEEFLAPLPVAVAAGLALGKMVGIFGIVLAAEKVGFAKRPGGANWVEIWGVSMLCGIGFTMSLFIGELAFPGVSSLASELRDEAKIGILGGSLISAICGYTVLRLSRKTPETA
ncbi:Na+/H+ antiporter NhaA [Qipengyuania sp.]|uniref:Na+/H+ antiporter NhaA n=1 Tax=Qipengyuania sp. TaxID=2004515 RepID=UPI0035C868EF